jgi:hypothetical protein
MESGTVVNGENFVVQHNLVTDVYEIDTTFTLYSSHGR